jgi:drug/metabolite transporter (DMT)-like permease
VTLDTTDKDTRSAVKNGVFVALIVLGNTFGNLFLAISMNAMPAFDKTPWLSYTAIILTAPAFWLGTFLLAVSMFAQLTMYTWADLSYILPVTASGYVITTLLGKFFLAENPSIFRWIGVLIISFGVVLVAETRPDTKHLEGAQQ